jgi:dipeptidyl aminopeptidase/acylaminoacyl peptidase
MPNGTGADYAVSESGVLAYIPGGPVQGNKTILQFTDRKGVSQPLTDPVLWGAGRLSPDGKLIANGIKTDRGQDIWVYDVERRTPTRLTFDENSLHPIWSPDGRSIAYQNDLQGKHGIYRVAADGSGKPQLLVGTESPAVPHSWSRDNLVYSQAGADKKRHLWILPMGGKPSQLGDTAFNEIEGQISPDGKWIAYQSNEAGAFEVYVQPFPAGGGKIRISTHGASYPRWAPNGKELFYWENFPEAQAIAVPIQTAPAFHAGIPEPLFKLQQGTTWDVTPDGKHFLTEIVPAKASRGETILGVVNWFEELRHRMPSK